MVQPILLGSITSTPYSVYHDDRLLSIYLHKFHFTLIGETLSSTVPLESYSEVYEN